MHRLAVLLAVSLVSSVADTHVSCPYASTCQRLNAMDDWRPAPAVHRSPPSVASAQATQRMPLKIFSDLGLTAQQIAAIDAGRPVAKVLSWGGPSEVYVFGAVHVDSSPDVYLEAARNVGRLSGTSGYQGVGEIRENATVADLSALALD